MIEHLPDVSFVIAAFNAQATVERAIASALAQTDVSLEVLVIDDCSSDRTAEIVAAHPDPRVRLIRLEQNRGPGGARNAGLAAALGTWIAILDSDDIVYPGRIARMIARARAADAQIVVDNLDVLPLEGAERRMFDEAELAALETLTLSAYIHSNVLFRSEHNYGYMKPVFERAFLNRHSLAFDESLPIGEDYLLLASAMARGGRCAVEPKAGYRYYIRSGSISRVLKRHHVDAMIAADAGFLKAHALAPEAMIAQRLRSRSLREAQNFVTLIDHLKARSLGGVLRTALLDPVALRHLRMPIAARLRRLGLSRAKTTSPAPAIEPDQNKV